MSDGLKDTHLKLIKSVPDFLKAINTVDPYNKKLFFRGHSNSNYDCVPSVLRKGNFYKREDELYSSLRGLSVQNFSDKNSHLEILTEMQHYSLPTRLLDITTNPLIALFFAAYSVENNDSASNGEVIILKAKKKQIKNFYSDSVEFQLALATMNSHNKKLILEKAYKIKNKKKSKRIKLFNELPEVKRLVHEAGKTGVFYQNVLDPRDLQELFFCQPAMVNARINNQNGAFISFGSLKNINSKSNVNDIKEAYIKRIQKLYFRKPKNKKRVRLIILSIYKKAILEQLDLLGINQASVYPDIEKRSQYIKEKF